METGQSAQALRLDVPVCSKLGHTFYSALKRPPVTVDEANSRKLTAEALAEQEDAWRLREGKVEAYPAPAAPEADREEAVIVDGRPPFRRARYR